MTPNASSCLQFELKLYLDEEVKLYLRGRAAPGLKISLMEMGGGGRGR